MGTMTKSRREKRLGKKKGASDRRYSRAKWTDMELCDILPSIVQETSQKRKILCLYSLRFDLEMIMTQI